MTNVDSRDINNYQEEYNKHSFESIMVEYRRKCVIEQMKKYDTKKVLEIGCGYEPIMKYFSNYEQMVVVEPGDDFYNSAVLFKNEHKEKNIHCYHSFIEDVIEDLKNIHFDFIIISSLMHELKNNLEVLQEISKLCHSQTVVHINVPNKKSFHRLLAYRSGIIPSLDEKSETQIRLQQNEFFDLAELNEFSKKAGFTVLDEGSYFIKPFTHSQMSKILNYGLIDKRILDGFYDLIHEFPENGSEIYVNVRVSAEK